MCRQIRRDDRDTDDRQQRNRLRRRPHVDRRARTRPRVAVGLDGTRSSKTVPAAMESAWLVLIGAGLTVVEVECPRQTRCRGKSDLINMRLAALQVLRMPEDRKRLLRRDLGRCSFRRCASSLSTIRASRRTNLGVVPLAVAGIDPAAQNTASFRQASGERSGELISGPRSPLRWGGHCSLTTTRPSRGSSSAQRPA